MKYTPFILIILWIIFISVYDKEWPRTNISNHDIDTLIYNQFVFPELLEEEDKKIIERYGYLDYFIIVDESKERLKLDTTIKEKTKRFSFLEDIYTEIEKRIDWDCNEIFEIMGTIYFEDVEFEKLNILVNEMNDRGVTPEQLKEAYKKLGWL